MCPHLSAEHCANGEACGEGEKKMGGEEGSFTKGGTVKLIKTPLGTTGLGAGGVTQRSNEIFR